MAEETYGFREPTNRSQWCEVAQGGAVAGTGWPRSVGYLKSQVIFRERAANYQVLLRKMTCKDKASYGSWPLCSNLNAQRREVKLCCLSRGRLSEATQFKVSRASVSGDNVWEATQVPG